MNEDEAGKKWCPFMGSGIGRDEGQATCLGSMCMMWRWSHDVRAEPRGIAMYAPSNTDGYCAVAGRETP